MSDYIGEVVGGCQLINLVGQGAMGSIYRAHHRKLNIDVAVKIINNTLIQRDDTFVSRFYREAQQAAKLNHPNIVRIYDVGFDTGLYYIIMEYIDGLNLKEILQKVKKILPEIAVPLIIQALKGLSEAHNHGVLHRDLKPDNLMLNSRGILKITDFGLAKPINQDDNIELTHARATMGTPAFMSIEQWQQGDLEPPTLDERADIYSLGVTLFHLLTGTYVYRAGSQAGILRKMYTGERMDFLKTFTTVWEPDRMAKIRSCQEETEKQIIWDEVFKLYRNLESLNSIILKLTAFNRNKRFSSAKDAEVDLEKYLSALDQKQVELFNSSFLEQLMPSTKVDDYIIIDDVPYEQKDLTPHKINKITFVKTEITDRKQIAKPQPLKSAPTKINLKSKNKISRHSQHENSKKMQSGGMLRKPTRKSNQNTVLLISSIAAVVAIIIILSLLFGDKSDLQEKYDRITESKPIEKTYTPERGSITHKPVFDDEEKEDDKVNKNEEYKKKLSEERKRREILAKFARINQNFIRYNSNFQEAQQILKKPLLDDLIKEVLIDQWLAFIEKVNEFKKQVNNFKHIVESDTDIQPDVKYCEIVDLIETRWVEKEETFYSLLTSQTIMSEQSKAYIAIKRIGEKTYSILDETRKKYHESEKIINEFIKVRNKIAEHKILLRETTDAYKTARKEYTSAKRKIYTIEKEIKKLELKCSQIERDYKVRAEYLAKCKRDFRSRRYGGYDRKVMLSRIETYEKKIAKLIAEYKEVISNIEEWKFELISQKSKREEYAEDMEDYEDDLKELEKIDISKWEKKKIELYKLTDKQEKIIKTGYSEIEKMFNNYHIAFCNLVKECRAETNTRTKKTSSQAAIARTKAELYQKEAEQGLANLPRFDSAVSDFRTQVIKYENAIDDLCFLIAIELGYMTGKKYNDICASYERLIFEKIEKGNVKQYKNYIKQFPDGKYTKEINLEIYNIAIEGSLQYCFAFSEMFPKDSKINIIVDVCIKLAKDSSIKDCKEVIERFPKHPKIKELIKHVSDYEDKLFLRMFERVRNGNNEINQRIKLPSGEYEITKTIKINAKGSLELKPGTTLKFAENVGLDCYGKLIAKGTKKEKIKFIAKDEKVGWRNIRFSGKDSSNSTLEYCLIKGGRGYTSNRVSYGGGIYITECSITIIRCMISNNVADNGGGLNIFKASVIVSNCIVKDNKSKVDGGAIVCVEKASLTVSETIIENNKAGRQGGGICLQRATGTFKNTEFRSNVAVTVGGGIQVGDAEVNFVECVFEKNSAENGGAIQMFRIVRTEFSDCVIKDNTASEYAGGIYLESGTLRLDDCKVTGNKAGKSGGGIYIRSGDVFDSSSTYKNNSPDNKNR
ncbi:MAG: protein kinase [Planctomycetes bacterium]|nr:protein kinase [Planctomycetota bacterium]